MIVYEPLLWVQSWFSRAGGAAARRAARAALFRSACLGLLLAIALPAWAQHTNEELMVILKDVVARDPDVALMGIGSWTGGNKKYKDPLAAEHATKSLDSVSDHDMKLLVSEGMDDASALAKWRKTQDSIREAVKRKYGSIAPGTRGHRVLGTINVYPPEQLVAHAEDASQAARIFRDELKGFPNLAIDPDTTMSLKDIEKKAADGIWGSGKAAYVQSYERQTGKLIYSRNGRVWVNSAELYHFGQGAMNFTPEGSISNAFQWLEKGRDALDVGDPGKVGKHLQRALGDIKKARNLLRLGNSAVTGELDMLVRSLQSMKPEDAKALLKSGRVQRALANAYSEGRLIEGYLRMGGKERQLFKHVLTDPHPRWTKLRTTLSELQLKLPVDQMARAGTVLIKAVAAYASYRAVAGVAAKAGEEGMLAAAKQAGIEVAMIASLPLGALATAVDAILEEAKSFGYGMVSMTQDCDNLLAGISQVKGSEGFLKANVTARDLAERYAKVSSVRDRVFYFADQATQRDYGAERGETLRKADEGRRDALVSRCSVPILQLWLTERVAMQDSLETALLGLDTFLTTQPFLVGFSPDPARLPAARDGADAPVVEVKASVRSKGEWKVVREANESIRRELDFLGGTDGREGTYVYEQVKCSWTLSREEGDDLVTLRQEDTFCTLDQAEHEWALALSEPGTYLVEFDWALQYSPYCPHCPIPADYRRTHKYKTAGRVEVIRDEGLAVAWAGRAEGGDKLQALGRVQWPGDAAAASVAGAVRPFGVSAETGDNLLAVKVETAAEADAAQTWGLKLLRVQGPSWARPGAASLNEARLSPGAPAEFELPFALGAAPVDEEGELVLDFAVTSPRGEASERSLRVPLWVQEPVTLEARFEPATREQAARLTLRLQARETVWDANSVRAAIGGLKLEPVIKVEDQGRTLHLEHRFDRQTPGAGRHTVQLSVADQRKRRARAFSVDFDYLLSLVIAEHALRPVDEPDAAPRTASLEGGERAALTMTLETFEPTPIAGLVITPMTAAPLALDPDMRPQEVARLARGKPLVLAPVRVEARPVGKEEGARVELQARVGGRADVVQPVLPLKVVPGETLTVVIDGPVDDARAEGLPNNADGVPQAGERVRIPLRVLNLSELPQPAYRLQARSLEPRLEVLDTQAQPGRALVRGDSEMHWVAAKVGKDVTGGSLGFGVELRLEGRSDPLDFTLQLELPALGPLAALRLPAVVFAFANEDTVIPASLPPRLMPREPVFVWEFSDTTQVWQSAEGRLVRNFRSEDSCMVRALLYDGDTGALVAAGGTLVVVHTLAGTGPENAANRKAVTDMAKMVEGQMTSVLASAPGATLDEKYQSMAAASGGQKVSEAQRLAMLEQFAAMNGGQVDVERIRQGFARLMKDPPSRLADHPAAAAKQ